MLKKKKKRKRITKHWSTDGENLGKKKTEVIRKKKEPLDTKISPEKRKKESEATSNKWMTAEASENTPDKNVNADYD